MGGIEDEIYPDEANRHRIRLFYLIIVIFFLLILLLKLV